MSDRHGKALRLVLTRVGRVLEEVGPRFPLFQEGRGEAAPWVTTEDGNWCAGYWIGLLWLAARHAAAAAERDRLVAVARDRLPALFAQPTGHIFAGLNHFYAGFLGFDVTGDPELRAIGLRGAELMLALYDPKARQIPIGIYTTAPPNAQSRAGPLDRRNLAAVDAIHTSLPVLCRGHRETGRADFLDVVRGHTRQHLAWHIRADGSTSQITAFDRETGAALRRTSTLAASDDGCWSRGLAWHVAGLASVHLATGEPAALPAIERSMAYYRAHCGPDLLPAWDLALADPAARRDASAAAITAYGLILLASDSDPRCRELAALGERILDALVEHCLVRDPAAPDAGAVLHGCYRHPQGVAVDAELIWSDFYVAAALDRLLAPA